MSEVGSGGGRREEGGGREEEGRKGKREGRGGRGGGREGRGRGGREGRAKNITGGPFSSKMADQNIKQDT